jgi:hypothetical protein
MHIAQGEDCPLKPEALQQARTNKINQRTRAMHGAESLSLVCTFRNVAGFRFTSELAFHFNMFYFFISVSYFIGLMLGKYRFFKVILSGVI